jgi:hypothetical protein
MIRFKCPHCGKEVSAGDEHAGKKGRCPGCRQLFLIPITRAAAAVKPAPSAERRTAPDEEKEAPRGNKPLTDLEVVEDDEDAPPPRKRARSDDDEEEEAPRRRRPARDEDDEEDDRPARRRRARDEEDEEDEEPRPRRRRAHNEDDDEDDRPRRKKRRRRGPYADCPNCNCRGDATRVYYSFGWGFLPTFFRTVRCNRCGTEYNGKHGDYNTWRYLIYLAIVLPLALAFGVTLAILENR